MDILFTGNLSLISNKFFGSIVPDYKCVVAGEGHGEYKHKNIMTYQNFAEEGLGNIFGTFNFETTVFFSKSLDGALRIFDELESLENTIYLCRQYMVKSFIYVLSNDISSRPDKEKGNSRYILMEACEELCRSFAENEGVHVTLLYLPYVYSLEGTESHLQNWLKQAVKGDEIKLQGKPDSKTDFLCEEDLGELLLRILDEPDLTAFRKMQISGGNQIDFTGLAECIRRSTGDTKIRFGNSLLRVPVFLPDQSARKEYGWYPMHILEDDIKIVVKKIDNGQKQKKTLYERRAGYQKLRDRLRVLVELLTLFVVAVVLNYGTKNNILLNFVDFRMIYVVIMGMMNGLNAGVMAAVLASLGYLAENALGMQWQVIFYNVQNWLPFGCYFLLGAISGYTRDKHDDEVVFAREELDILEQKYIFLNELYVKVLENKDSFNSQIIGYQDSFGKLYAVVKKLNTMLEDEVLYEAVNVLEDMLDNQSVAIYTINGNSDFARLNVCSKSMNSELSKSLKLSDFPEMLNCLKENKMFVNTMCFEGYPVYATPVYNDLGLLGMILLKYANDRQMNMEFSNKFTIVTDLIRDSMIRAMQYDDKSRQVVEGTHILKPDKFREVLDVKEQMREKEYLDYTLLRLEKGQKSLEEIGEKVAGMVRNNDVLGLLEDGEVYLLLSQTGKQGMDIIRNRMEKYQIEFEIIKG